MKNLSFFLISNLLLLSCAHQIKFKDNAEERAFEINKIIHGGDINTLRCTPDIHVYKNANWRGETPLQAAVIRNNFEMVKFLIAIGANNSNQKLIYHATANDANGSLEIIKLLHQSGCSVNEVGWRGDNALFCAILQDNLEIAEYLVAHGADPYTRLQGGDILLNYSKSKEMYIILTTSNPSKSQHNHSAFHVHMRVKINE